MKTYDSYKDSGVEWIGDIPRNWRISKFKFVTDLYTGNSLNDSQKVKYESNNTEDIPYVSSKDIDVEYQTVNYDNGLRIPKDNNPFKVSPKGSFLMVVEGGSSGRKKVYLKQDVCFVNKLCSFNSKENTKFQYYFVQSSNYQYKFKLSMSGLIGGVSISNLKNFELTLPTLSEQQQIVSFLDTKTSLIDSLIEKTQQKIKLLKEKRTSLIIKLVTKGLNSNVEMKNSGVEWIGKIPCSWEVLRMCYMFKPISIKNTTGEMNLSVYRDYGVIPTHSRSDNHNVISEDISNYKLVEKGDFVMNKMKCWMGSLGLSDYRGIVSPSYTVMKPLKKNNHKYIHYLLRSKIYIPQYKRLSYGVREGQWDLRFEDFKELPCLIPPLDEQNKIVKYLDLNKQSSDNQISIEEKRIELLKEYRQSLISEVVTGKRKVV